VRKRGAAEGTGQCMEGGIGKDKKIAIDRSCRLLYQTRRRSTETVIKKWKLHPSRVKGAALNIPGRW